MSRLLTSGFEGAALIVDGWNNTGFASGLAFSTSIIKGGARSMRANGIATSGTLIAVYDYTGATNRTYSWKFDFYVATAFPSSTAWHLFTIGTSSIDYLSIQLTSSGTVLLFDEIAAAQVGSASSAISLNTWYRLEGQYRIGTGATDTGSLYLDGVQVASSTTLNLSDTNVGEIALGIMGGASDTADVYFDNFALNDDQGANQTGLPGIGYVANLYPISDSARGANWVGGGGGTTNLWDAVNNKPPVGVAANGTDSSQIRNSASDSSGNYDATMTPYVTAGIQRTDTITLVQAVADVGCNSATSTTGALFLVSNPAEGAETSLSFSTGGIAGTWPTNWGRRMNAVIYSPSVTKTTSPVLRVGKRQATTRIAMVDHMTIIVEYIPMSERSVQLNQAVKRAATV